MNELDQRLKENMERMQQRQEDLYRNRIDSRAKLRDEFAKSAMESLIISLIICEGYSKFEDIAEDAYKMADAMLTAREQTK